MENSENQRQKYRPFIENKIKNEENLKTKKVRGRGSEICLEITKWIFISYNILMLVGIIFVFILYCKGSKYILTKP